MNKKFQLLILLVSLMIISLGFSQAATYTSTNNEIYECGTIIESGNYYLNQSFSASGGCINSYESNVNIDFNGFIITGNGIGVGINIGSETDIISNLTIQNGTLYNFNKAIYGHGSGSGIYINDLIINNSLSKSIDFGRTSNSVGYQDSIFDNITFQDGGSFWINNGKNNNYTNLNFYRNNGSLGTYPQPVFLLNLDNGGNLINNTIFLNNTGSSSGFTISGGSNDIINDIVINNSQHSTGSSLKIDSDDVNISNLHLNNILNIWGIYISGDNVLLDNFISDTTENSILIENSNFSLKNSIIKNVNQSAIYIFSSNPINNLYLNNVTINNTSTSGLSYPAFYVTSSNILLNASINNVNIMNVQASSGFYIGNGADNYFTNITTTDCAKQGFYGYSYSDRTTIKNYNSTNDGVSVGSTAVYFFNSDNNTLQNIRIFGSGYNGLAIDNSSNNVINDLIINGSKQSGIYINGSNNSFDTFTITNNVNKGIYIVQGNLNNFDNGFISKSGIEALAGDTGYYGINLLNNNTVTNLTSFNNFNEGLWISGDHNVLYDLNISNNEDDLGNGGIYISGNNNQLTTVKANYNDGDGSIHVSGDNNIINNITAIGSISNAVVWLGGTIGGSGPVIVSGGVNPKNNTFQNLNFDNNSGTLYGGFLILGAQDNKIMDGLINDNAAYGIYSYSTNNANATNNYFSDLNITGASVGLMKFRTDGSNSYSLNNTLLNLTILDSDIAMDNLNGGNDAEVVRRWYIDLTINDKANDPIGSANVSAYEIDNSLSFTTLSNSTGNILRNNLIEYNRVYNSTGDFTSYHTPHTINISRSGFDDLSTSYNLSVTHNIDAILNMDLDMNISLVSPANQSSHLSPISFNCYGVTDPKYNLENVTLQIWNSTGIYNQSVNTSITTLNGYEGYATFSIDFTYDDNFKWNCLFVDNSSNSEYADLNRTFYTSLDAPAITLNHPEQNDYLNYYQNVQFNFTASDANGVDTCELWTNTTGSWARNYTWNSITSGIENFTTLNLPSNEVQYLYNVWCNDSFGNADFTPNNFTFEIDTTNPDVTINSVSTSTGSRVITFSSTITDKNLDSCNYTLYKGTTVDPEHNNKNFLCNSLITITASEYSSHTLYVSGVDKAGNVETEQSDFSLVSDTGSTGSTGSSSSGDEEEEPAPTLTFCGDNTCQSEGNDYGVQENFYTCPQDCQGTNLDDIFSAFTIACFDNDPSSICFWTQGVGATGTFSTVGIGPVPFNVETSFINCFDTDNENVCFWETDIAIYILFFVIVIAIVLSLLKVNNPSGSGKVSIPRYVKVKIKRRKWKRRR